MTPSVSQPTSLERIPNHLFCGALRFAPEQFRKIDTRKSDTACSSRQGEHKECNRWDYALYASVHRRSRSEASCLRIFLQIGP
jgi:hypothetical protein